MSERTRIEERLRKKEAEIRSYEDKAREAKIYIQALRDILKMMDKSDEPEQAPDAVLRSGSMVAQARAALLDQGKAMHIDDLLTALGKELTRETRASLTGSLAAYVRRHEIFTRPAPSTFGLIEFKAETASAEKPEPPRGFGQSVAFGGGPTQRAPWDVPEDDAEDEIPF